MASATPKVQAWIIGTDEVPEEYTEFIRVTQPGQVLVNDRGRRFIGVITREDFDRQYEWAQERTDA